MGRETCSSGRGLGCPGHLHRHGYSMWFRWSVGDPVPGVCKVLGHRDRKEETELSSFGPTERRGSVLVSGRDDRTEVLDTGRLS